MSQDLQVSETMFVFDIYISFTSLYSIVAVKLLLIVACTSLIVRRAHICEAYRCDAGRS